MPQTYNTRIQLKSDTQANWRLVEATFRPLPGEFILYSPDNDHPYCRIKVGNSNQDLLRDLPFIDAGTINGNEVEIVKLDSINNRPQPGSPDKLYVDTSTNKIYHYDANSGYTQLSNFTYNVTKSDVSKISSWSSGIMTSLNVDGTTLKAINGVLPELLYYNTQAVSDITKE